MGFLFKNKKERQKQERRSRRQAFRQAEKAIDDVKDRIKQLDREASKQWDEAKAALKGGQKAAAQRLLTSYRAAQVLMTKQEQKRWVFEQYLMKMESAQTDNEFSSALAAVNQVVKIDPEQVADVFESSQDILGEQLDADRFWNKLYDKETNGAANAMEEHIPEIGDMMTQLESESAAEIGGDTAQRVSGEVADRISNGQKRVQQLLDEK